MSGLFMMVIIFGIMYFLLIAPMRKKQKAHAQMVDNLKTGDRVVTNGGIFGTVVGIAENKVQLRIAEQVKIELSKSAVSALQDSDS